MTNDTGNIFNGIIPFILLILLTLYLEFRIKYRDFFEIKNFYLRGIRISMLIVLAIVLNEYGGVFSIISFVLTYVICALMDKRYRNKIEICWEDGTKELNAYLENKKPLKLSQWLNIRIRPFKDNYKESFDIFKFKIVVVVILLILMFVSKEVILKIIS